MLNLEVYVSIKHHSFLFLVLLHARIQPEKLCRLCLNSHYSNHTTLPGRRWKRSDGVLCAHSCRNKDWHPLGSARTWFSFVVIFLTELSSQAFVEACVSANLQPRGFIWDCQIVKCGTAIAGSVLLLRVTFAGRGIKLLRDRESWLDHDIIADYICPAEAWFY